MKPELRRYAPLGLYLALLAALVSAGLYIVFRQFDLKLQISLGLIVIGLALFALLDPDRARRMLTGRQARYGSNAFVLSLAFIGVLVVINYLVYNNSKRWDLTENKSFTLAAETQETLSKLPEPVMAQAFFTRQASSEQASSLLEQYRANSDGKFEFEFIDPDANPALAEQAKITRDGTVVLSMSGNQEQVTSVTEQELTGALVRLMNPVKRSVLFLSGHGERSLEGANQEGLSLLKRVLESKNYIVGALNLLAENQIPADTKVIVIAGARKPLTEPEVALLKAYQEQGGSLVVLAEPLPVTDFGEAADPLADYLAQNWNISLGKDIVVDLTSQQPFSVIAANYGSSPITQKLNNIVSQFPTARSATVLTNTLSGVSPVELVFTAQQSWAERTLDNLTQGASEIGFDPNLDMAGPVSLAVSAENFQSDARVVAVGDSDFCADANFAFFANGDFVVNAIDWAAGQEDLISLTPKETQERTLLPPQSALMNLILLATVVVVPGLALLGGILVFIQRRRRM